MLMHRHFAALRPCGAPAMPPRRRMRDRVLQQFRIAELALVLGASILALILLDPYKRRRLRSVGKDRAQTELVLISYSYMLLELLSQCSGWEATPPNDSLKHKDPVLIIISDSS